MAFCTLVVTSATLLLEPARVFPNVVVVSLVGLSCVNVLVRAALQQKQLHITPLKLDW